MKTLIAGLLLAAVAGAAIAQATPAGLWKTIDDKTKAEKSLVRITEAGGVFSAKVEKIFDPAKQDARCEKCSDERKDQPVVGLSIVRGVKASPSDPALWDGGEILDPNNGKTYKSKLELLDGGRKLGMSGCIAFLCRQQVWLRQ